jgi:hypothetical protein
MNYVIQLLETEKKSIERSLRNNNLMHTDMQQAVKELAKITEIKRAVKMLKSKEKKWV